MDLCYLVESTCTILPLLPAVTLIFPSLETSVTSKNLLHKFVGVMR